MLSLVAISLVIGCGKQPRQARRGVPRELERTGTINSTSKTMYPLMVGGDPIENWYPRSPMLSPANETFGEALRSMGKDVARSQMLFVEAGHQIRDKMQLQPMTLEDEDRFFASEALFQQACVLAETRHLEDALEAIRVAQANGFYDVDRLIRSNRLNNLNNDERFHAILEAMRASQESEVASRVRFALGGTSTFGLMITDFISLEPGEERSNNKRWKLYYCMGHTSPPCMEMIDTLVELYPEWKRKDWEFVTILLEPPEFRQDFATLRKWKTSSNHPFRVLVVGDLRTYSNMRGLGAFPSIILVNDEDIVHASISGIQSRLVVEGILKAVNEEREALSSL